MAKKKQTDGQRRSRLRSVKSVRKSWDQGKKVAGLERPGINKDRKKKK